LSEANVPERGLKVLELPRRSPRQGIRSRNEHGQKPERKREGSASQLVAEGPPRSWVGGPSAFRRTLRVIGVRGSRPSMTTRQPPGANPRARTPAPASAPASVERAARCETVGFAPVIPPVGAAAGIGAGESRVVILLMSEVAVIVRSCVAGCLRRPRQTRSDRSSCQASAPTSTTTRTGIAFPSDSKGELKCTAFAATPRSKRARFDNQYIENWSIWQDFVILGRTAAEVVRGTRDPDR
jgi:hypothetical protein